MLSDQGVAQLGAKAPDIRPECSISGFMAAFRRYGG